MNSDEPQTNPQQPEKQSAALTPDDQQLGASDHLKENTASEQLTGGISPKDGTVSADQASATEAIEPLPELKLKDLESTVPKVESSQSLNEEEKVVDLTQTVAELERQERDLREKIVALRQEETQIISEQLAKSQALMERILQEGLKELEQRKQALEISIEQLERRRERIRAEMRTSFAGVSQELAIRVQGFKDYLVGSLEDLVSTAEELELSPPSEPEQLKPIAQAEPPSNSRATTPQLAQQQFQEQTRQIRKILDQYRNLPDYYGPPWQLRRTFEPIHAERVSNWFFSQGGRGAIKTMGSRLQNILIASATISVLRTLYAERLRTLVLANTPERLGEWRRGLQDCLGISRSDFGPERGVVLFEEASALVQKADRLVAQKQIPLIVVDETADQINLSMLQFPLWLAFARDPQQMSNYQY
ncbi:MAG: DUF3086 domain-containing protein [Symploca sp. SIO2E9]|nr:DUF3086 domain-containing protein [Symploca sp. SIO2E9]